MKRLLLILAVALSAAGPAQPETAVVRSGSHQGFTRLVITLASPSGWRLGRSGGGYELRLKRRDVTFDLGRAFDRIARQRLSELAPLGGGGRLRLVLSCACYVKAFAFRPNILVVDIHDGPPPAKSPFETTLPPFAPSHGAQPDPAPAAVSKPAGPYDWRRLGRAMAPAPINLATVASRRDTAIRAARETLLKQLARAGAQGLIEADPERLKLAEHEDTPADGPPPTPQPPDRPVAATADKGAPPPQGLGLTAQTEMDRDSGQETASGLTPQGRPCPPAPAFDVGSWADPKRPAGPQIADRRRDLLGEFDRPKPAAVAALAKLYINLGFGAEARTVLDAFPVKIPDAERLRALSGIIDGNGKIPTKAVAGYTGCRGPAAMWSMLASPPPGPAATIETGAVLRNFALLPARLRRLIGPALARRFLDRGDTDTSLAIRNAIARVRPAGDPAVEVLDARLDVAQGKRGAADARLRAVVKKDALRAPKALALLVENRVAMGRPVDPAVTSTIEAMLEDHRGTPTGRALSQAHILALGSEDRFDAAFRELAARSKVLDPATGAGLWAMLADRGSDESLLTHALVPPKRPLPDKTRLTIARRLLALGFDTAAKGWIASLTLSDAARLDLAKAAVEAGRGDLALSFLADLPGKQAQTLAAQAYGLTGDYAAQEKALAGLDDTAKEGVAAWRAGDWTRAAAYADGARRAAVALTQGQDGHEAGPGPAAPIRHATPAPAGPLARDRALLKDSAEMRARLEKLLSEAPLPGS